MRETCIGGAMSYNRTTQSLVLIPQSYFILHPLLDMDLP